MSDLNPKEPDMTLRTIVAVGSLLFSTFAAAAPPPPGNLELPLPREAKGKLIVHEWGTFTNFAGSDGVYMEYRPLVFNDLPEFVLDRGGQTTLAKSRPAPGTLFLGKARIISRSRMETPVTYFYTDAPMQVEARVDFPHGMLTDLYPAAKSMSPLVDAAE